MGLSYCYTTCNISVGVKWVFLDLSFLSNLECKENQTFMIFISYLSVDSSSSIILVFFLFFSSKETLLCYLHTLQCIYLVQINILKNVQKKRKYPFYPLPKLIQKKVSQLLGNGLCSSITTARLRDLGMNSQIFKAFDVLVQMFMYVKMSSCNSLD